ncbi:hypothetical protein GCM10025870_32020 [Agromyces marinus]|uniref:Uncharacterized protein n=1 Tax=Agromyces marinus TaxID=1389020 RepID=A0ABN6YFH2_9MICO|nr:hypothetical protein GCM10025870_32020 [Agromyces marinus]
MREVPGCAVDVDVLRVEARAALGERLPEHLAHRGLQLAHPPSAEARRGLLAVHAHGPQGFVGVDVADARHNALVEEHALDAGRPAGERRGERVVVERRVERVARDVRHLRGDAARPPAGDVGRVAGDPAVGGRHEAIDRHRAEDALVDEVDPELAMLGVLEVQPDPRMAVVARVVARAQQQLPAHAEVADQCGASGQRHPQELAAPHRGLDALAGQQRLEIAGCRVVPLQRPGVEHLDPGDVRARDRRREPRTDDLDLGKLGHVSGR